MLHGKPLIAWSIEQALSHPLIDRLIVSTDSVTIADVAKNYGAEVPFLRPSHLATDSSPEILSWHHLLNFIYDTEGCLPDTIVSLPATSPLRSSSDIESAILKFKNTSCDLVITVRESQRNPFFNIVIPDDHGYMRVFSKPPENVARRQDCPLTYDITTVAYVTSPEYVLASSNLLNGRVASVTVPLERSIDIDSLYDFNIAEYLLSSLSND